MKHYSSLSKLKKRRICCFKWDSEFASPEMGHCGDCSSCRFSVAGGTSEEAAVSDWFLGLRSDDLLLLRSQCGDVSKDDPPYGAAGK